MNNNSHHQQYRISLRRKATAAPVRRAAAVATLALGSLTLAGCASGPHANPRDPFEPYNRTVTDFNDGVDRAVLKPAADAYRVVVPSPVRTGVSNFFANLGDMWSFVNNVLQFRGSEAMDSLVRFNVNTVFGLGGVLDIASEMGIPRRKTDFGLTLGRWGVPTGPYLVLPLLGPSTVRDTAALPIDVQGNPLRDVDPVSARNQLYVLRVVDKRASLLAAGNVLETAALDKYSFTRDVFLRVRSLEATPDQGDGTLGADDDAGYDPNAGKLPPTPQ